MELSLPNSLYGVTIAEPLHLNRKVDGTAVYVIEMIRTYLMLAANYFIQLYFIYEVWQVDRMKESEGCVEGLRTLQFICVLVFEVTIFSEIRESLGLLVMLYKAEHKIALGAREPSPRNRGGAVLMQVEEDAGVLTRMMRRARHAPPAGMPQWSVKQMPRPYKFFCIVIVGLPKLLIGVLLGCAGGVYIARCDGVEEIILNALAVNFVVEIDEILFNAFTSSSTKDALEHVVPVSCEIGNRARIIMWFTNAVVYPLLSLVATIYILIQFLGECPLDLQELEEEALGKGP